MWLIYDDRFFIYVHVKERLYHMHLYIFLKIILRNCLTYFVDPKCLRAAYEVAMNYFLKKPVHGSRSFWWPYINTLGRCVSNYLLKVNKIKHEFVYTAT